LKSILKKLAGQTAIYGLSSILGRFLNYLLTPLYTYQFSPKDYGVVTEFYAYVAFLVVFLTYGMETAFFRYINKEENPKSVVSTAFGSLIVSSSIFLVLTLLFSTGISSALGYPSHPEYVIWFALILALDAVVALPLAYLRHQNKAVKFAGINLGSIFVNLGFNLFFIGYCKPIVDAGNHNVITDLCYSPEIGVGYVFISNLASSIFKLLFLMPLFFTEGIKIQMELLKNKMLPYGLPILLASFAGIINEVFDRVLLKYLLIPVHGLDYAMTQVGIYGACYKVSILITLFVQAFRYAAEPFFFTQSKEKNAQVTYSNVMFIFTAICAVMFLVISSYLNLAMHFVGEDFREGVTVVPFLLMANVFLGLYYNLSIWYKLTDKTNLGAIIALIGAVLTLYLNYRLIPVYGYLGSALATLICYVAMFSISYFIGQKYYKVPYKMGINMLMLIVAVFLFILLEYLPHDHSILGNAVKISINLMYIVFLYFVYGYRKRLMQKN